MEWVVDASVALAWCFADERTPATATLLQRLSTKPAIVPQNWKLEIANILANSVRRGRLTDVGRKDFVKFLKAQLVYVDAETSD
jgi:hypothetical protein